VRAEAHVGAAHVEDRGHRLGTNRLGLLLFMASEAFLFLVLLTSRFVLAGTTRPAEVNRVLGAFMTLILLSSSVTAGAAERSVLRGSRAAFLSSILATMVLGAAFLVLVGVEWTSANASFGPDSPYGSVFFLITGMHALHLLSGLVLLALVYAGGRRDEFSPEDHWDVQATVWYWHFVDIVWLSVFTTLYLA